MAQGGAIPREAQRYGGVGRVAGSPFPGYAEPMRAWLAGDCREEPRFPLQHSCDGYAAHSRRLAEIDGEIEEYAAQLKAETELRGGPRPPGKTSAALGPAVCGEKAQRHTNSGSDRSASTVWPPKPKKLATNEFRERLILHHEGRKSQVSIASGGAPD